MSMSKKSTDFRYNTGATMVPWAAVGENYNVSDLMEIIRFLMQGDGAEYEEALKAVFEQVKKLDALSTPPGKLSLGSKVEAAEEACNKYLGISTSTFVTNATAGFEIAYKYANLKPGDEVIVPAITFVATMAYPLAVGAKLVFADVDPKTINMDPKDVARKITDKTKMIVASTASPYKYVCDWFKIQFPNYKKAPVFKDGKLIAAPVEAPKVIEYKQKMPKAS